MADERDLWGKVKPHTHLKKKKKLWKRKKNMSKKKKKENMNRVDNEERIEVR